MSNCAFFLEMNRGDVKDTEIEACIDSIVDSLFSVLVTLGGCITFSLIVSKRLHSYSKLSIGVTENIIIRVHHPY